MNKSQNKVIEIETLRHSYAHILAQAILRLFPEAKLGIGPATKKGFYYDFELSHKISYKDLKKIEKEMRNIVEEDLKIIQIIVPKEQAFNTLFQLGQVYKTELLRLIEDDEVSFYKTGDDFIDLCRGPHVKRTGILKFFKLTNISEDHWLKDPARPIFQRIEGVAFSNIAELKNYFLLQDQLKDNDYQKIGSALELFNIINYQGSKLPILLNSGIVLKNQIKQNIFKILFKANFQLIQIPDNFQKNNNSQSNSNLYSHLLFKAKKQSYQTLPLSFYEFKTINNIREDITIIDRSSKELCNGSIFCTESQIYNVIQACIGLSKELLTGFGFSSYKIKLAYPKFIDKGTTKKWEEIINIYKKVLEKKGLKAHLTEEKTRSGSPELIFVIKDIFEREWETSSIYFDVFSPQNYNLIYYDKDQNKHIPFLIKYNPIKNIEETALLLTEHYKGALPLFLAPIQVVIISISNKYNEAVKKIFEILLSHNIRAEIDIRDETMQSKIRKAQIKKVPYTVIIGEKEIQTDSISIRPRSGQTLGLIKLDEFITKINQEVKNRVIDNIN